MAVILQRTYKDADGQTWGVYSDGTTVRIWDDGEVRPRDAQDIQQTLAALNGESEELALSNGIPGLLGLGGLSAKWGLDRVPWWIWAGLAAGAVLMLSSRRGR